MQRLGLDPVAQRRAIEAFSRGKTGRDNLRAPLQRQRDRARDMQKEADQASGRVPPKERDGWFDIELIGIAVDLLRWLGRLVARLWH